MIEYIASLMQDEESSLELSCASRWLSRRIRLVNQHPLSKVPQSFSQDSLNFRVCRLGPTECFKFSSTFKNVLRVGPGVLFCTKDEMHMWSSGGSIINMLYMARDGTKLRLSEQVLS